MKTRKTVSKRFRVTPTKVIKRYCGQEHYNARGSSNLTRKKRVNTSLSKSFVKTVRILTNTF